jgi:hypothetical protein
MPVEDRDLLVREQRIRATSARYARDIRLYHEDMFKIYLVPTLRERTGRALSISGTSGDNGIVTVRLEPPEESVGAGPPVDTIACGWGRPKWTKKQIVGKRVRVLIRWPQGPVYVDDVINGL